MFNNLRINIFIYYFITVALFLAIFYYSITVVKIENITLLATVMLLFTTLSAFFISKLAIDPLQEHIETLKELSNETLHELNLPISTILTNLGMLEKNSSSDKELKRIVRIREASKMLQDRYNELDYMIKSQTEQDMRESFSLDGLIYERVDFLKDIYPHIEFNITTKSSQIYSDKIGLSKVIDNLIDNGIKYSNSSKIIDITIQNSILSIKDYGCGMDELALIQIFDKYYQANREIKGYGIGLNMVKRFCDKNRIELRFDSTLEVGTTVTLKFNHSDI